MSSQQRRLARRQKRQGRASRPAHQLRSSEVVELTSFFAQAHAGPQGEVELAREQDSLTLPEDATLEEIEATLAKLRGVLQRFDQGCLEPDDRLLVRALLQRAAR